MSTVEFTSDEDLPRSSQWIEPIQGIDHFGSNLDTMPPVGFPGQDNVLERSRAERKWGRNYKPPVEPPHGRRELRRICDEILDLVRTIDELTEGEHVPDECYGAVAEILFRIEKIYDCTTGEGESIKAVAMSIKSQLANAEWTTTHIAYLRAAMATIKARYIINDQTAEAMYDLIDEFGLDMFRGTVSDANIRKKFKIVEDDQ